MKIVFFECKIQKKKQKLKNIKFYFLKILNFNIFEIITHIHIYIYIFK